MDRPSPEKKPNYIDYVASTKQNNNNNNNNCKQKNYVNKKYYVEFWDVFLRRDLEDCKVGGWMNRRREGYYAHRQDASIQHGASTIANSASFIRNGFCIESKIVFITVMVQHLFQIPVLPAVRKPEVSIPSCLFSLGVATWIAFHPILPFPNNFGKIKRYSLAVLLGAYISAFSYQLLWLNLIRICRLIFDFLTWILDILASDAGISLESVEDFLMDTMDENSWNYLYASIVAILFTIYIMYRIFKFGDFVKLVSSGSSTSISNKQIPSIRTKRSNCDLLIQGPYQAYTSGRKCRRQMLRKSSLCDSSDEWEN